jgi:hypothetical protein
MQRKPPCVEIREDVLKMSSVRLTPLGTGNIRLGATDEGMLEAFKNSCILSFAAG